MELGIKDKVALVTGASKNIGKSIAIALAREKTKLILVARSKKNLEEVKKILNDNSNRHLILVRDLTIPESISQLKEDIKKEYDRVDIIVHNLGGSLGITNPLSSSKDWLKVWNYNLGIGIDINREFIPDMIDNNWGRIVHLSSATTSNFSAYAAYTSSKCALEGYVKSLSKVISKNNVIINCIAPGIVDIKGRYFNKLKNEKPEKLFEYFKNHLPIERMCTTDEVANAITFLCSNHASYMPGLVLKFDGIGN